MLSTIKNIGNQRKIMYRVEAIISLFCLLAVLIFILDKIASKIYGGYKEKTDLHAKAYVGEDTDNRGGV